MTRVATFDDWKDMFRQWEKEIDLDVSKFKDYEFEIKFEPTECEEIEFGDFKGRKKWETVLQIPDQRIRDGLQHLIVYQGDTEFGSVEQQRRLLRHPPNDYDLGSLVRVMREEMRHGWQMCYLLVNYFGHSGKIEAQKLLERRSFKKTRLLGSFNQSIDTWLDFFCFTQFVDRDGKYQLGMLHHSGFGPLARSMGPMRKEEFYHVLTGHTGLARIIKAGRVPRDLLQRFVNKWYPSALDLFGVDNSTSAAWFYVWGLKGRYDEHPDLPPADRENLNDEARHHYMQEMRALFADLNQRLPADQSPLRLPEEKFNRKMGRYADMAFDVNGEPLAAADYMAYLASVLPGPEDYRRLEEICKDKDWIVAVS
ncbi:MAG: phenylacetate-CoA oxygenase subunit PaaI [Acidobacteria bacterium]|nr:phenylacetate-CoA oxygenase subunit PaaI [Acidobacteriota bacterium]MBI3658587.1 phenylacetate-CoA oxygenase subunit PaaI [Acidobacteriota bacterium]